MQVIKPVTFPSTDGSFARASTATYFDRDKVLQTAAINAPRYQYNPETGYFDGLLLEDAATNSLTYSEQFDNAAWTKSNATISANAINSPGGTAIADKLVETATTAGHEVSRIGVILIGQVMTFSVFVKAAERTQFAIKGSNLASNGGGTVIFNLLTGTILSNGVTFGSAEISNVGNGWYRCSVTFSATASSNQSVVMMPAVSGSVTYLGDTSSGLYIWGAQLETGSKATSYIPTAGSTLTRSADVVTGTGLIYSTVTDTTPAYSSGTTYALGATVRYLNKIWQSLQATNLNHQPDTYPTWWFEVSPDNIHAAFDTSISTVSSATTEMTFSVKIGLIDSVALINLDASISEIAVTDFDDGTVYTNISGLTGGTVYDWYQYFFYDPLLRRTQVVYSGIPPYANAVVTVRLRAPVGTEVSVAQAIFGSLSSLGKSQYGASAGIVDYSVKNTDEFGVTTFVKRAFSKRLNVQFNLDNTDLNRVQSYLYSIRATPAVWVASTDTKFEEALVVYGFYRDFTTEISYPTHSQCSIEIEGLS